MNKKEEKPENTCTVAEIEQTIDRLTGASPDGKVTMTQLIAALPCKEEGLTNRIDRVLKSGDEFFDDAHGNYQRRAVFFRNFRFVIVPDRWEIENRLLIPGHRFAPFVHPEIIPSETVFTGTEGVTAKLTELTAPLAQLYGYYMLLGSEQVFDVLVADSPANFNLHRSHNPEEPVTIHAFDMAEFYRKNEFSEGDALLCTIRDYDRAEVEFRYLDGGSRKPAELKKWNENFETALQREIDRFEEYLEIPDQLAWSFYLGQELLTEPEKGSSIDEFCRTDFRIQLSDNGEHTILTLDGDESAEERDESCSCTHHHHDGMVPEGFSISKGETGELEAMLREVGSPLTPVEVDSFILDNCYARELEFEDFFARAFGREKLHFADEAQQTVFTNYAEERFEELTGNYNRIDDELKAPVRSAIMELVEDRLAFFDLLSSLEETPADLPQQSFRKLAEIAMQLNEILKLLNHPGFTPGEAEISHLAETVEARTDDQEKLIAELSVHVEDKKLQKKSSDKESEE